ncbi:hypothetical protein WS98_04505 [Burkholderia territorii]|uniref:DUF4148 domain-containing protein n=1 Tax=Burkholderia territorii TaxID=1503055 RepID=A0A118Y4L4_9BURK|nr:hypothetical protein [Burkholderia territorii]AOI65877.1 hypothetical protein WS51_20085 [Burkholderia territorii]KAB0685046.1 hypothetical protein F7R13_06045 [Burkholderia territorii]KUY92633.1 hypothetical protein WS47_14960 [Burkholderia territorii]KUZ10362.1 hypothetical protein WS50_01560 [Burkholderia territorii]KUZ27565.1 hypothetical protein WS52_28770 [Burkholderia territorii]
MRSARIALMLTIALAGPYASNFAYAQRPEPGASSRKMQRGKAPQSDRAADTAARSAVPPDLEQRRRDGHMTPEERHLLRQHIEDAVRELYKR